MERLKRWWRAVWKFLKSGQITERPPKEGA